MQKETYRMHIYIYTHIYFFCYDSGSCTTIKTCIFQCLSQAVYLSHLHWETHKVSHEFGPQFSWGNYSLSPVMSTLCFNLKNKPAWSNRANLIPRSSVCFTTLFFLNSVYFALDGAHIWEKHDAKAVKKIPAPELLSCLPTALPCFPYTQLECHLKTVFIYLLLYNNYF